MARARKNQIERRLTDVELELMGMLWRLGEGTVADVQAALPSHRALAYTSVSTMLRILQSKGFVTTRKQGRGHVYVPAVDKAAYEAHAVRDVVDRVFDGMPVALVRQLLENVSLDETEIRELRKLLSRPKERK
jgi:predicted transcriptional regulator